MPKKPLKQKLRDWRKDRIDAKQAKRFQKMHKVKGSFGPTKTRLGYLRKSAKLQQKRLALVRKDPPETKYGSGARTRAEQIRMGEIILKSTLEEIAELEKKFGKKKTGQNHQKT